MSVQYYKTRDPETGNPRTDVILRIDDNGCPAWIPADEENKDYREYLAWEEIPGNDIQDPIN